MKQRHLKALINSGLAVLGVVVLLLVASLIWQPTLGEIHQQIERDYPNLNQISGEQLQDYGVDAVVFDVRDKAEYDVSHINNAIHLPKTIDAQQFIERFASKVRNQHVVFYCSVGRRSSRRAHDLRYELMALNVKSAASLKGGLFTWMNEERPLTGTKIHPYNRYWARLIDDQEKVVFNR